MTGTRKIVLIGFFLLIFIPTASFAKTFPPRYSGDLEVCSKVSKSVEQGKSFESALVDFFLSFSNQPSVESYYSIQRAIVYDSVKSCHFDGADVIHAALRIDMSLPLLALSMNDAGVSTEALQVALQQAGLDPGTIQDAYEEAGLTGQSPSAGYALMLPPPYETTGGIGDPGSATGGGLGQASPFMP